MAEMQSTRNFGLEKLPRGVTKCKITSLSSQPGGQLAHGAGQLPLICNGRRGSWNTKAPRRLYTQGGVYEDPFDQPVFCLCPFRGCPGVQMVPVCLVTAGYKKRKKKPTVLSSCTKQKYMRPRFELRVQNAVIRRTTSGRARDGT